MKPSQPQDASPRQIENNDALVRDALDILEAVSRGVGRQLGGRYPLDDLKGHAHEAVLEVVRKFDPTRGVPFRSYARLRLRGAIIDGLRRDSGLPRGISARLRALHAADLYVEEKGEQNVHAQGCGARVADASVSTFLRGLATAYATGLLASEPTGGRSSIGALSASGSGRSGGHEEGEDPEATAQRSQARDLLERALTDIGDPEGTILRRHYFLDEDLQDAAAHVGLSKSWGSRLHARGIEKLAARLAELRESL